MFKILTDKLLEPPLELMKLVKMTLSLPHGQAGVESGFSNTKSIVEGRESLNHTSVKAQKLVQCALRGKGGAQHVPITTSMMNAVRGANAKYLQELEEEKRKRGKLRKKRRIKEKTEALSQLQAKMAKLMEKKLKKK